MRGDFKYVRMWFVLFIRSVRPARFAVVLLISADVLFGGSSILRAEDAEKAIACEECKPGIALPGEPCRVLPWKELKWTELEKWA